MHDTSRRRAACLVALVVVVSLGSGAVAARGSGGTGEAGEAGAPVPVDGWAAVGTVLLGTVVLMASIKLLVRALVRTAVRFGVSTFLLAVVFSGWEFDNVAFGLFTGFRELQNVAFGLAIGNAVSIFGLTLAVGALLFPFETDVPRDYLAILVGAPLFLVPVVLSGTLTTPLSVAALLLYAAIFAYIVRRERTSDRQFMRSEAVAEATAVADGEGAARGYIPAPLAALARRDWFWPLALVVAVGGVVVGAKASAVGVAGVLDTWDLAGTVVGVTFVTLLYTLDDLLLIAEPLRLGYDDIAVGGVVGSLLFFVTANVGVIGLVGDMEFAPQTALFHLPALLVFSTLSGYLLWRGRLTRRHGALLLGLYVLYLLVAVWQFATVPVPE